MLELINSHRTEVDNDIFGPVQTPQPPQQRSLNLHPSEIEPINFDNPETESAAFQVPPTEDTQAFALNLLGKPSTITKKWPYGCIPRYLPEDPVKLTAINHVCPNESFFPSVIIPLNRALEGISQEQISGVCAIPEEFLVLVFFLDGWAHFTTHPDIISTIQTKL
jgi:hypothetical protein